MNRIACLASDLRCGLLAAGTTYGSITVRKNTALMSQPNLISKYQGQYTGIISQAFKCLFLSFQVFKYTPPAKEADPMMDFSKCWETQPAFQVWMGGEMYMCG